MATPAPQPLPEPLRLPRGSVRGGIALLVTVTFGFILLNTGTVATVLVNAVIVVIAFYFGSGGPRSIRPPSPAGMTPAVPAPKPTRLVRFLIFAGFLGLAGWFL